MLLTLTISFYASFVLAVKKPEVNKNLLDALGSVTEIYRCCRFSVDSSSSFQRKQRVVSSNKLPRIDVPFSFYFMSVICVSRYTKPPIICHDIV